jgi:hypothetical protein
MRIAVLAALAACSGGIAFEDFDDERRRATCDYYVRCGAFGTSGECEMYFERFGVDNPSLQSAIAAGKVRYDGDAAQDCVDALAGLDCKFADQAADALAVCDDVLIGTGKIGAACAFDRECATDRCVVPDCEEACCQGTCQEPRVRPGVDEPCTTVCAGDLFCGFDQLCHTPLGAGEPCNGYTVCAQPLYCSSAAGACSARPTRGQPCDGFCAAEGDVCTGGVCAEAAVGGDPCTVDDDCSPFYKCEVTARCELPPAPVTNPNGTPCTFNIECASRYCDTVCTDVPLCF